MDKGNIKGLDASLKEFQVRAAIMMKVNRESLEVGGRDVWVCKREMGGQVSHGD